MFYNFPGAPGNTGYQAQANPNPLIARDPSFQIPQRGIRGMSPEDIKMLKQWDPKSADEIERIRNGMPRGGIQLPLASSNGMVPMGNAGFFAGPQYGQQMPTGFQNKTVS